MASKRKAMKILTVILLFMLSIVACDKHDDVHAQNDFGITLEAENVTPTSLDIVCRQFGGNNVAELNTGSFFVVQKLENAGWTDVEYASDEEGIAWTMELWIIEKESANTWDVNWEWIYGKLPAGEYRIGKQFLCLRDTGETEQEVIYANFTIK